MRRMWRRRRTNRRMKRRSEAKRRKRIRVADQRVIKSSLEEIQQVDERKKRR